MIAVNVTDLTLLKAKGCPVAILLKDFANEHSPTVQIDKAQIDSGALLLDGPAAHDIKRLQALVELLHGVFGKQKIGRPVRVYQQGPRGGWRKVKPGDLVLTADAAQLRLL
jgi:hypothetical protein